MNDIECPYCGYGFCDDELGPEASWVQECFKCKKKYHASRSYSVDYSVDKDCELNNEPHQWGPIETLNWNGKLLAWRKCCNCDSQDNDVEAPPQA